MRAYREHRPTGFDSKGAFLPERQTWLVCPVMQTRDSATLAQSNFAVALRELGGESDTVEVHRFGHWGPGWYEIILIMPDSPAAKIAEEIETGLENYPVLDEDHWSTLEYEKAAEYWEHCSVRERVEWCQRYKVNVFAARRNEIPEDPQGGLVQALAE